MLINTTDIKLGMAFLAFKPQFASKLYMQYESVVLEASIFKYKI